jgi:hypothetical protein
LGGSPVIAEADTLALVEKVGAQRHNALAGLDAAHDGDLLGEPANLHCPQ